MIKPSMPEPTPEMIIYYEWRTDKHINRVRRCLLIMALVTPHAAALRERAEVHDASKYSDEERIPYIWLTEYHRCRRSGELFTYPEGMEAQVRIAINHHVTTNRHHPEFYADPNDMSDVDLIEMVCDWTAMAQELDQDGGSARGWADKVLYNRLQLDYEKCRFIYDMIDLIDTYPLVVDDG